MNVSDRERGRLGGMLDAESHSEGIGKNKVKSAHFYR
jgi:hypothetical protein